MGAIFNLVFLKKKIWSVQIAYFIKNHTIIWFDARANRGSTNLAFSVRASSRSIWESRVQSTWGSRASEPLPRKFSLVRVISWCPITRYPQMASLPRKLHDIGLEDKKQFVHVLQQHWNHITGTRCIYRSPLRCSFSVFLTLFVRSSSLCNLSFSILRSSKFISDTGPSLLILFRDTWSL